jgi:HAD superfamily hydrolase (TIGR01457 family)
MKLQKYKTILLDGDGVLWKSNQPIPGIKPFFDLLNDLGVRWALLTNNNTRTAQDYIDKLENFGISAGPSSVFTSSTVTADYLLEKYGKDAVLHVVGMDGLTRTLKDAGFQFTTGEEIPENSVTAVVAGMDREINLQKITIAMRLIMGGADFIATNTDGSFPTPDGINPGTGTVIGALQFASGTEPYVVGKPQPAIFQTAMKVLGSKIEHTLMVGDRLNTDILGANKLGIQTAAVLTGVTSRDEINQSEIKPDFIFEDIRSLHQALEEVYRS